MKININIYIIIGSLLLFSCKKDEFETVNRSYGKGYSNSTIGAYNIYKVEEIIYNDFFNTIDTLRYQLKEVNESYFTDNLNRNALRVERYKLNEKNNWQLINVWYSVEDNVSFERIEENIRFVKLSFPLNIDVTWNNNAFNSGSSNFVYYDFINENYTINNLNFDSAVSVTSDIVSTSLRQRQFNEVYAKNVGLIYKHIVSIDKNGSLKRGFKYDMQLIQHEP